MTESKAPRRSVKIIIIVKISFAFSFLPSPRTFETSAVPPVPIMKPMPPSIITNGITRLIEAKAVLPAKFETKSPSTTP